MPWSDRTRLFLLPPISSSNSSIRTLKYLTHPHPSAPAYALSQDLSPEYFAKAYEASRVPVVITGALDKWPAQQQWTPQALLEQFKDHKFKVHVILGLD